MCMLLGVHPSFCKLPNMNCRVWIGYFFGGGSCVRAEDNRVLLEWSYCPLPGPGTFSLSPHLPVRVLLIPLLIESVFPFYPLP